MLGPTYKMTLMYFLVNIHFNNQSTLYKVNGLVVIITNPFFSLIFLMIY
jgi:hypothetical protein